MWVLKKKTKKHAILQFVNFKNITPSIKIMHCFVFIFIFFYNVLLIPGPSFYFPKQMVCFARFISRNYQANLCLTEFTRTWFKKMYSIFFCNYAKSPLLSLQRDLKPRQRREERRKKRGEEKKRTGIPDLIVSSTTTKSAVKMVKIVRFSTTMFL